MTATSAIWPRTPRVPLRILALCTLYIALIVPHDPLPGDPPLEFVKHHIPGITSPFNVRNFAELLKRYPGTKHRFTEIKKPCLLSTPPCADTLLIVFDALVCGDIQPNPGPIHYKFPCGICSKAVRKNQKGICCDDHSCSRWFHARCVDIDKPTYTRLSSSDEEWLCPLCCLPQFSDSFFDPPQDDPSSAHSNLSSPEPGKLLSGISANVRSIKNKAKDLEVLIHSYNGLGFLALTETWLDDTVRDHEILPPDFAVFRRDRQSRCGDRSPHRCPSLS